MKGAKEAGLADTGNPLGMACTPSNRVAAKELGTRANGFASK